MPANKANEPFEKFHQLVQSQSALLAIVGSNYGKAFAVDQEAFPSFAWRTMTDDGKSDLDDNPQGYRTIQFQFDLFGTDEDQLVTLADLVDEMNDKHRGGLLDTVHWKCNLLRRMSAWKTLPYRASSSDGQAADGNVLFQMTSDWRYKLMRKESVA